MKHMIKRLRDGILFGEFLLAPEEYRAHVFLSDAERRFLDRVAVYIAGQANIVRDDTNEVVAVRKKGDVNSEIGKDITAGRYKIVAGKEGCRYVCFFPSQSSSMFEHRVIRLKVGESFTFNQGRVLFLCLGKIKVNGSEELPFWSVKVKSENISLTSMSNETLIFEMWR